MSGTLLECFGHDFINFGHTYLGSQIKDFYTSMSVNCFYFITKTNGCSSLKISKNSRLRKKTYEVDNETWTHKFIQ